MRLARRQTDGLANTRAPYGHRQVNKSWQACDLLDESWCPIVWVHRLFESPPGLLMEKHGQSLAKVLRGEIMPEPGKGAPASFDDDARAKVAQDVAAAMRFLHDLGVMHGDLKVRSRLRGCP